MKENREFRRIDEILPKAYGNRKVRRQPNREGILAAVQASLATDAVSSGIIRVGSPPARIRSAAFSPAPRIPCSA